MQIKKNKSKLLKILKNKKKHFKVARKSQTGGDSCDDYLLSLEEMIETLLRQDLTIRTNCKKDRKQVLS